MKSYLVEVEVEDDVDDDYIRDMINMELEEVDGVTSITIDLLDE